jgi:hypothetical protein
MISPCVRHCTLDPESGLCVGCGRTLAEIGKWTRYTDDERRAIMDTLPDRLAAHHAVPALALRPEARR